MFELPPKNGNITPEKARKSRQNSVCLGSLLLMRSFAIDDPRSPDRALYATLKLIMICHFRPQKSYNYRLIIGELEEVLHRLLIC